MESNVEAMQIFDEKTDPNDNAMLMEDESRHPIVESSVEAMQILDQVTD
jgi:hypothetical protein